MVLQTLCNLGKVTLKSHTVNSCVSPIGLRVPGGYGQTSFLLSRGPRPEGGALVTTPRPMVPRAPALLLAWRLGSFFKLRRRVVARFPRLRAETILVIPRLPLVRDRRLGQSDPLVESGDIELLAWLPPAAPVPGGGRGHPGRAVRRSSAPHSAGVRSQALTFARGSSWRPSRIPPRRRKRRRERTSRWW